MGSLKIPKEQSEAVFWRMAKKRQPIIKKHYMGNERFTTRILQNTRVSSYSGICCVTLVKPHCI